jgi:hypothetical protein
LIDVVERSGLTGRGGAGFPTGRELRSVLAGKRRAVIVANGAEGEPGSAKDHQLLSLAPHLVLDGISLAAQAVGARDAYLAVHRGQPRLVGLIERALAQRDAAGVDPVPIRIAQIPRRYVSSEQSAIVQFIDRGLGKPTYAPPRPHERGVGGRPTLVNNVETLAQLALIARHGDVWFRCVGPPEARTARWLRAGRCGTGRARWRRPREERHEGDYGQKTQLSRPPSQLTQTSQTLIAAAVGEIIMPHVSFPFRSRTEHRGPWHISAPGSHRARSLLPGRVETIKDATPGLAVSPLVSSARCCRLRPSPDVPCRRGLVGFYSRRSTFPVRCNRRASARDAAATDDVGRHELPTH